MTVPSQDNRRAIAAPPRIFGLDASALHEALWATRRVRVVRRGTSLAQHGNARFFLLLDSDTFVDFAFTRRLRASLRSSGTLSIHVPDDPSANTRERLEIDEHNHVRAIRREYAHVGSPTQGVILTKRPDLARRFASGLDVRPSASFETVHGRRWQSCKDPYTTLFELLQTVTMHRIALSGVRSLSPGVLAHDSASVSSAATLAGPALIGGGHRVGPHESVHGPVIMTDLRPVAASALLPNGKRSLTSTRPVTSAARRERFNDGATRAFDILFSATMLAITAPAYPIILARIALEDGRPFFFTQERLGKGGRPFRLIKFRTMRRDAERSRDAIAHENQCDGAQFHIPRDPRALRSGHFLRRWSLDELPQFFNVLRGEMSIVGPRPLTENENRYSPAWRERRLSVKPGITGLWQIRRTRQPDIDFQEWVRYDTEYVRRRSLLFDLSIVLGTIAAVVKSAQRGRRISAPANPIPRPSRAPSGVVARIEDGRVVDERATARAKRAA